MPLSVFHVYSPDEFENYIRLTNFNRTITFIQNHHTFRPGYTDFFGRPDHMFWLESMRRAHRDRGWNDIGQNITIFPDGKVGLCRAIDITPAGIFGANTGAICIENLGFFDRNKDVMKDEQKQSIIRVNAVLCFKFALQPVYEQVVYHHWFDTTGARFVRSRVESDEVNQRQLQKTCPGTAFFGGNHISNAETNFYPPIKTLLDQLQQAGSTPVTFTNKKVIATLLNVRSGADVSFPAVRKIPQNTVVQVYKESAAWSKISPTAEEWVSSQYLMTI